jgi:hypothetical protein
MPGKRPVKKGSFGSHFDEVVKHFTAEARPQPAKPADPKPDLRNIHDRLLEAARHKHHTHSSP